MRITYSTCGIIPYPCAHISFWEPRWIVTTTPAFSGGVQNQGKPHYHLHNAVVRPVNHLFRFNDPCTGCTVPTLAALVPAFYESRTDPAWRTAQSPFMTPEIMALKIGVLGRRLPEGRLRDPPDAGGGLGPGGGASLQHRPSARCDLWPVQGVVRPTIPLVPSAQGIGPFPWHVPLPDANPAILLPGGLRHGKPDDIAAVANGHL